MRHFELFIAFIGAMLSILCVCLMPYFMALGDGTACALDIFFMIVGFFVSVKFSEK